MINADPIASQIAINQCEAELSALGERRRISMRVRGDFKLMQNSII